jgi:hypothetical protein
LAKADALKTMPSWYKTPASAAATNSAARSAATVNPAVAMPATGPTGGNMTERLKAEAAKRGIKID